MFSFHSAETFLNADGVFYFSFFLFLLLLFFFFEKVEQIFHSGFSSRARILVKCATIHSTPALFCLFFDWRLGRAH